MKWKTRNIYLLILILLPIIKNDDERGIGLHSGLGGIDETPSDYNIDDALDEFYAEQEAGADYDFLIDYNDYTDPTLDPDSEDYQCFKKSITLDNKGKEEDCTSLVMSDPLYRCCYVKMEKGNYKNDFCLRTGYAWKSIKDVKSLFKHASHFSILCNSNFIGVSIVLFIVSLIFII